jgi:O-antigen/teichoic acid export membrane protein
MIPADESASSLRSLFKRVAQGSSLYSLAYVLPQIASVLLLPVTTRFLTRADYGIADLLQQTATVASVLLGLNFASSIGYFYFKTETSEGRATVTSTSVIGAFLLGSIGALVCWPFAGLLSGWIFPGVSATAYLRLCFAMMPVNFALEAFLGWLRVESKPGIYTLVSALRTLCTILGTVVLLVVFKAHVWGILWSTFFAVLAVTLFLIVYCFRTVPLRMDPELFWRMARFSLPTGIGALAMFAIHFGDRFILPHYRPFDEIGIYSLAYKMAMLLSVANSSFLTYWGAQIFGIMRRPDADYVFSKLFTYVAVGLTFCALALICWTKPVLLLMAGPRFQSAEAVVPVLVLAYYIRGITDFFRYLFLVEGRTGYDAVCSWIGAAACVAAYFVLIPGYGIRGAAWATVIAFGLMGSVSTVWTYRMQPYRVESGRLFKMSVAFFAALAFRILLPGSTFAATAASATVSLAIFPIVLLALRFPTREEGRTIRSAIRAATSRRSLPATAG